MQKSVLFVERITPWYLFGLSAVMLFSGIAPLRSYSASHVARPIVARQPKIAHNSKHVIPSIPWDDNVLAEPKHGSYQRFLRVRATAYVPRDFGEEGGRYTVTQRDGQATHGIAVDPSIIPLGTRLWIPGYGHAIADDIGSKIQGHRIDVRVQDIDRLSKWGVRDMRVYVLSDPQ